MVYLKLTDFAGFQFESGTDDKEGTGKRGAGQKTGGQTCTTCTFI